MNELDKKKQEEGMEIRFNQYAEVLKDIVGDNVYAISKADFFNAVSPLLTEIENLKREVEKYKWISVDERLPEPELVVIICNASGDFNYRGLGYVDTDGRWWKGSKQLFNVTHWMPLPTSPII